MSKIITLTSDWGLSTPYAAMFKALILKQCPHASIVDITHDVDTFNIEMGVFLLSSAYHFFPEETVHVFNVDYYNNDQESKYMQAHKNHSFELLSFVDYLAVKYKGHYFLGINNGFFSLLCKQLNDIEEIVKLPRCNDFDTIRTFDAIPFLLKPAIALSENIPLSKIGEPYSIEKIEILKTKTPLVRKSDEKGIVVEFGVKYIDNYGNIITDLHKDVFDKIADNRKKICIYFNGLGQKVKIQVVDSYSDVAKNSAISALFNISGYLEISTKFFKMSRLLGHDTPHIYDNRFTLYFEDNKLKK